MSGTLVLGRQAAMVLLVLALAGCVPNGGPASTESATPSAADPRILIECFYADGTEVATFTRLEEAWASTNYVRIDSCEARPGERDDFELTTTEAAVAGAAAAGVPDEDPIDLYLRTVAACVRIAPDGEHGMAVQPTSILEAALMLCPEAPHAGLIEAELDSRE